MHCMAVPHSWSVHLLIDLLVADSVMPLRSSDYDKQTGWLFVFHVSVQPQCDSQHRPCRGGHMHLNACILHMHSNLQMLSVKHIKTSKAAFGRNETIKTNPEAGLIQRMEGRRGRKTNEKSSGVEGKAMRPSLICRPVKRSRKQAKLCEALVAKSPT